MIDIKTNEELIKLSQIFFYQEHPDLEDSRKIFELMDDETRLSVIDSALEDCCMLSNHELKFVVQNKYTDRIAKLFEIVFNEEEIFEDKEYDILGTQLVYDFFNFVKERCEEEDDPLTWKAYEKDFNKYKAKNRNKRIDEILED